MITKIDLSTIDSSTRPKIDQKKKADQEAELPPVEEKSEVISKTDSTRRKEKTKNKSRRKSGKDRKELKVREGGRWQTEEEPLIENIKAEKIEGPGYWARLSCPRDSDTRPVKDEKRKRKRIFIEKRK